MSPASSTILERLLAAHRRGERLVLVFDYDGTLTPLVAHPSLAHLDPALRDVLARLAATPRVTVGVVSGRGLDDLIGMVGLEGLSYGGSTGLELELAGERRIPTEVLGKPAAARPADRRDRNPAAGLSRRLGGKKAVRFYRPLPATGIGSDRTAADRNGGFAGTACRQPARSGRTDGHRGGARHRAGQRHGACGPSSPTAAANRRPCCTPATPPTTRQRWRRPRHWAGSRSGLAWNRRRKPLIDCPIPLP